jgi:hypothetical protein
MIIIDTPSLHDEVDENAVFSASPTDIARQSAIAAMHSTEETFDLVRRKALEICPDNRQHTFGDWEDACIRGLMELHCAVRETERSSRHRHN